MENDERPEGSQNGRKRQRKKGVVYITAERCKGCGYCVAFCPTHVLALANHFNQKGYHPPEVVDEKACTGCGLCGMYCPDFAIFGVRIKNNKNNKKNNEEKADAA